MNYKLHYQQLIERAKSRTLTGYSERHHIIPECMGGNNSKDNIVRLTPEEHYVAHQLLVKMHPGNYSLLWAAMSMTNQTHRMRRGNKLYGWLRRRFAEAQSKRSKNRVASDETRRKQSEAKLGKKRQPHSEETKRKMSEAALGKPKSKEHRETMSKARMGKKTGSHSQEWNEKIRRSNLENAKTQDYSYLQDEEYKRGQSERMREIWAQRKAGKLPPPKPGGRKKE